MFGRRTRIGSYLCDEKRKSSYMPVSDSFTFVIIRLFRHPTTWHVKKLLPPTWGSPLCGYAEINHLMRLIRYLNFKSVDVITSEV